MTATPVSNNVVDFANSGSYPSYPVSQQNNPADNAQLQNVIEFNSFINFPFDSVSNTPTSTEDVWEYSLNGTPTGTVTVTYTDSTKNVISTIVRS